MKKNTMTLMAAGVCAAVVAQVANAAMVAQWDFQTTTNGGTAVAAAPNSPLVYVSNFGTGTLYLDGTNGSSAWKQATSGNEISAFGGTAVNATGSMSTVTTLGSLALIPGARSGNGTTTPYSWAANGKSMVFKVSMTNLANLEISYATQRSSVAGFTTHQWDYSINGTSWTTGTTVSPIPTSFATSSLAITSGLNNAATAYVRVTFTGGTDASANTRVDNFQFNATALPAPGAVALIGLAGMVASRRRRN